MFVRENNMLSYIKAILIMLKAHKGQKDKAGKPYFLHPLRVSKNLNDKRAKIVALLHDVLEDSDKYKMSDLSFLDSEQREALGFLTHKKNDDYFKYIEGIKANKIARAVKIADLRDNSNLSRIKNPTDKDIKRIEKYRKAMEILKGS